MNILEFIELKESAQIDLLQDLEFEEEAHFKWEFFKEILLNINISDLTRIEVLNILGATDIPNNFKKSYNSIILNEIKVRREDEMFINHCIMALQNDDLFTQNLLNNMVTILLDFNEDLDIRMNAFTIVNNNSNKYKLKEYFTILQKDSNPYFVENSSRWLEDLKND